MNEENCLPDFSCCDVSVGYLIIVHSSPSFTPSIQSNPLIPPLPKHHASPPFFQCHRRISLSCLDLRFARLDPEEEVISALIRLG